MKNEIKYQKVTLSEIFQSPTGKQTRKVFYLTSFAQTPQERCVENWSLARSVCEEMECMDDLTWKAWEESNRQGGTDTFFKLEWRNRNSGWKYFEKFFVIRREPRRKTIQK